MKRIAFKKGFNKGAYQAAPWTAACALVLGGMLLSGCQQQVTKTTPTSNFIGHYAQLKPLPEQPQTLFYQNPNVDWSRYQRVMIKPVSIRTDARQNSEHLSKRDQLMSAMYFEYAMKSAVQQSLPLVEHGNEGTVIVRAAINEVSAGYASDSLGFENSPEHGEVVIEGEIIDARTGERLIAIVDKQMGSLFTTYSSWNDVTLAFDRWAEQLHQILNRQMAGAVVSTPVAQKSQKTSNKNNTPRMSQAAIEQLLEKAQADLSAQRLTSPSGNNAFEKYQAVLNISPDHPEALQGLRVIVENYANWGVKALQAGQIDKAQHYLSRARSVGVSNEQVDKLELQLEQQLISQHNMAAAKRGAISQQKSHSSGIKKEATVEKTPVDKVIDEAPTVASINKGITNKDSVSESKIIDTNIIEKQVNETLEKTPTASAGIPQNSAEPKQVKTDTASFDPWKDQSLGSARLNEKKLRPFVLGLATIGEINDVVDATSRRLKAGGFQLVGQYSPYQGAHILIISHKALKHNASLSEFGGYGAVLRVSVTQMADEVQVAYTNPYYLHHIYRMKGSVEAIAHKLSTALGKQALFGSESGIASKALRSWHYMFGMPYFDDPVELTKASSYQSLLKKIEVNLSSGKGGTKKVYRVDIPGKQQTIFGVAMTQGAGSDNDVMKNIDKADLRHTAHLPYEILVSENRAYILNAKFRIALSFPDLTMGQFMQISTAPGDTEEVMKQLVID